MMEPARQRPPASLGWLYRAIVVAFVALVAFVAWRILGRLF